MTGRVIERRHDGDGGQSRALWSDCGVYRYLLSRRWGPGGTLLYILLNPSTATEVRNDPTVERCERRARTLGYDGFAVVNLFAFRATRPNDLLRAVDPIGPATDRIIHDESRAAETVLCGWGMHGGHLGRGEAVAVRLRACGVALWHLGLTREGHPRHPLYVPYAMAPQSWLP